ncbi:MAG: hypothetical protein HYY62_01335 [Deltaproteobacteria bacterium]|nr:hypothetical protein [Deltaproteobacteria bacterium]
MRFIFKNAKLPAVSNIYLQETIRKLWEKPSTHRFMNGLSQLIKDTSLEELVLETAAYTACRCCDKKYSGHPQMLPHSLLGFEGAWSLTSFFYSKNRLLPLVQMMWYAMAEARSQEVDIKALIGTPPTFDILNFETFKKFYLERNFEKAFPLFVFLMRNPEGRKAMFPFLISQVLSDEAQLGHKLIYVIKTWQFCEVMKWQQYHLYWFPVIHSVLKIPPQTEIFSLVESYFNQNAKNLCRPRTPPARSAGSNGDQDEHGPVLLEERYRELRDSLYNDEKSVTLEKLSQKISEGYTVEALFEGLKLASCELILGTDFKHWMTSLHALHVACGLSEVLSELDESTQIKALLFASLFIKKMAILSKPFEIPSSHPLKTVDEKNTPSFFLEHAIIKGDVSRALGALEFMIAENKITSAPLELLAFLASKNTYSVLYGHDIQCAAACLKSYTTSQHPLKAIYLKALVKLLASEPKEQTIYNALQNTQTIKPGYYSTEGNFQF